MRKPIPTGLAYIAISIALVAYFYISSYGEMLKLCKQLGYKGSAVSCLYQGPMVSYWIALSITAMIPFLIGVVLISVHLIKKYS